MKQTNLAVLAATLVLAACQQADAPDNVAVAANEQAAADTVPANGDDPLALDKDAPSPSPDKNEIVQPVLLPYDGWVMPAQFRGRWGMVPADCTSTRGDAKGLMTIGDRTIRFYESTATLKKQRPAIATSFAGLFGFTGEGQTWEKVMIFTRTGDTLKRADDEGSFTYKRCA